MRRKILSELFGGNGSINSISKTPDGYRRAALAIRKAEVENRFGAFSWAERAMTAAPHAEREHSVWAASSTAANWSCVGRIALSTLAGPERENIWGATGTAAHEVSERALREGADVADYVGEEIKTKDHVIEVDESMAREAQIYVDYVRARVADLDADLIVEKRLSFNKLVPPPPFDAGGTADALLVSVAHKTAEIVDLKFGTIPSRSAATSSCAPMRCSYTSTFIPTLSDMSTRSGARSSSRAPFMRTGKSGRRIIK